MKRDILEKVDKVGYFNNCRNVKNVINSKINNLFDLCACTSVYYMARISHASLPLGLHACC
jgi:hypothetical protein